MKEEDKGYKVNKSKSNIFKEIGPYINFGWQLVITIALCTWLGWWLDEKFNTSPILIIVFSLFGAFAGMFTFIRTVLRNSKKDKLK